MRRGSAAAACGTCAGRAVPWGLLVAALLAAGRCPATARVTVRADAVVREHDRFSLLGTNIAAWYAPAVFESPELKRWLADLGPVLIRIPGGSWGDLTWWNGNGVRSGDAVDMSKHDPEPFSEWSAPWGTFRVDYSGYAPGFLMWNGFEDRGWHGHVDVKTMHEYIRELGARALVIVNAGQGSPRDAAEWVRWANKTMGYGVRYWEVGNELGGGWEAGHRLPDGSELNGRIFARRYEEFARAMKAVDPSVKVGLMDWVEEVLDRCGELVDFVSIHTYPVSGAETNDELFAKVGVMTGEVGRVRALIAKHRPNRKHDIEVGYTEWSVGWADIRAALWHAMWIGEMFRQGVDFANQFDVANLAQTAEPLRRRAAYWGHVLWSRHMGDELVEAEVDGDDGLSAYATRSDEGVAVMLINRSDERVVETSVALEGAPAGADGLEVRFTAREYLFIDDEPDTGHWNKQRTFVWNRGPTVRRLATGAATAVSVPPSSIVVVKIPGPGAPAAAPPPRPEKAGKLRLSVKLPAEGYANTPVEGWVMAFNGREPAPHPDPPAGGILTVKGPAKADRAEVRLSDGAGRFRLIPTGPGTVKVAVRAGDRAAKRSIAFKASVPRPAVFWEFEHEEPPAFLESDWTLGFDPSVRPNQRVARVDLDGTAPDEKGKRVLLRITELPDRGKLRRSNIRGAFFDCRVSADFACADPDARIGIVMQSPQNWWMPLGGIKLAECSAGEWTTVTRLTEDPAHLKAMAGAKNVWFVLVSGEPVAGSIFIDRAGLMVR